MQLPIRAPRQRKVRASARLKSDERRGLHCGAWTTCNGESCRSRIWKINKGRSRSPLIDLRSCLEPTCLKGRTTLCYVPCTNCKKRACVELVDHEALA